jgi:hypothetical protein
MYTRGQLEELSAKVMQPIPKAVTFTGATGLGAQGTINLYTIEQDGVVAVIGKCTTDLIGTNATIAVGTAASTASLIPQFTATTLDAGERIDRNGVLASTVQPNVTPFIVVAAGDVIIATIATADVTAGVIEFGLVHRPFGASEVALDSSGNQIFTPSTTSTATFASVASSASAVTLLAANSSRKTASIFNDSTAVLYVAEFPTATATVSATSYTAQIAPGGFYTPATEYNGLIQGIWASANGFAKVTEH